MVIALALLFMTAECSVPSFHLVVCEEKHAFPSYASADGAFIDSLLFAARFMAMKFHFAGTGSLAVTIGMRAVVVMWVGMGAVHDDDPWKKER